LKQGIIKRSRGWLKQQQRRLTASNQGETIASVKMKINKLPLRT